MQVGVARQYVLELVSFNTSIIEYAKKQTDRHTSITTSIEHYIQHMECTCTCVAQQPVPITISRTYH